MKNVSMPPIVNVDYNRTKEVGCVNCGGTLFTSRVQIREVPAIYSPSMKPEYVPTTVFQCVKCHTIVGGPGQTSEKTKKGAVLLRIIDRIVSILPFFLRKR
jgi:hypothetical protein